VWYVKIGVRRACEEDSVVIQRLRTKHLVKAGDSSMARERTWRCEAHPLYLVAVAMDHRGRKDEPRLEMLAK